MRVLIKRITPCAERRIWFTFEVESRSEDYLIIQSDHFLAVRRKKSCESRVQSMVQSRFCKGPLNNQMVIQGTLNIVHYSSCGEDCTLVLSLSIYHATVS